MKLKFSHSQGHKDGFKKLRFEPRPGLFIHSLTQQYISLSIIKCYWDTIHQGSLTLLYTKLFFILNYLFKGFY